MALKLGINKNISNKEYHADREYLSSSVLKTILDDLAEYERMYIKGEARIAPSNQSALDEGSLAHSMILEPHLVASEYQFFKGPIKKGPEWTKFMETANPKLPIISTPQKDRLDALYKAYQSRPEAVDLITNSRVEETLCVELMGVKIKVRADAVNVARGFIADVKTTGYDGNADQFKQTVEQLSYQLSAALYSMAFEQQYGVPFDFYFIVLSKRDYNCEVYKLGKNNMAKGRAMVTEALLKFKKAQETNNWKEETNSLTTGVGYEIIEV